MKNILMFSAVAETATGIAAIFIPSIILHILFDIEANEISITLTRFTGICLGSLGIACWPRENFSQALRAMFLYNLLVAIFFTYIGVTSSLVGILLWPVAILHLGIAVILFRGLKFK